jgi:O-acetylhomoserine (thiol)-lyase
LHYTLPKLGIETTFIEEPDDLDEWRRAIRPNTSCSSARRWPTQEPGARPRGISAVAHEAGIPLMVEHGAHAVPVASVRMGCRHRRALDDEIHRRSRHLDRRRARRRRHVRLRRQRTLPGFTEPDPSYHGLAYWPALGHGAYIIKARVQLLRDIGASTTPFNSFLFLQGVETLSLRIERHNSNALRVAEYLEARDEVEEVFFPGLASSPWKARAEKLFGGRGYTSVPAFLIKGGLDAGRRFIDGLELHSHVANIGDVRSLAIHPASTTHSQLSESEQLSTGVHPGLVRLSVGLESIDDILADLDAGFRAAKG